MNHESHEVALVIEICTAVFLTCLTGMLVQINMAGFNEFVSALVVVTICFIVTMFLAIAHLLYIYILEVR
jgi:hypothetical protein